jgi:large subunit ribosomal protein L21
MAKAEKDEVVYAIVRVGGKQYKVAVGDVIEVDRVGVAEGKSLTLEPLAVRTSDGVFDGARLKGARVKATVQEHFLGPKIRVFTYKPKTTYKKMRGHRSRLSRLAIEGITLKEAKEKDVGA